MVKLVGILLAAGSSKRFGTDKLLMNTPQNKAVAVQACHNLLTGVDKVLAVNRPNSQVLSKLLHQAGAAVVVCPNADKGMGASLAYGISSSPEADGWLIALADMPWIRPETICAVAGSIRAGADIAVPTYRGKRGHPVGFSGIFRDELAKLNEDSGAKILLEKYRSQICYLECHDPGILRDIDFPADLE